MAPKKVVTKGQPLPNSNLQELIAEAIERKRLRDLRGGAGNEAAHRSSSSSSRSLTDAAAGEPALGTGVAACSLSQPPAAGIMACPSTTVALPASSTSPVMTTIVKAKAKGKLVSKDMAITKPTSQTTRRRKDIAIVKNATRGDKKLALEVASNPQLLDEAIQEYRAEVYSAGDTSTYYIKTWSDIHRVINWSALGLDGHDEVLPLTPDKITAVGAAIKKARYKGPKKYMTAIKQHHIAAGWPWSDLLAQAAHRYNLTTTRGLGPSRQSEPLPFGRLAQLDLDEKCFKQKMPANPAAVITLSTFYLLRELEMAAAKVSDILVVNKDMEVRLRLSMSKNDPSAKGTERPWRCVCSEPDSPFAHRGCPYHAAVHHLAYLKAKFPKLIGDADFPLFPDQAGEELLGDNVLDFIELLAAMLGLPLMDKNGVKKFGKHSFRSTGAVHLAEMGLEVSKIQLIGRWLCGIVLHYCRLAPLTTTADDYRRGKEMRGQDSLLKKLMLKTDKLQEVVKFVSKNYEDKLTDLQTLIQEVEQKSQPRQYVQNRKSGKTHRCLTHYSDVGPEALAYCGFKYGKAAVRLLSSLEDIPYKALCSTCLKEQRDAMVSR